MRAANRASDSNARSISRSLRLPLRRQHPVFDHSASTSKEDLAASVIIERLTPALSLLLQVDGLIVSGLVELCTPHLVHALVVGPAEDHGRAEPNVEVAEIFQSPD